MTASSLRVAANYAAKYPKLVHSGLARSLGLLRSPDTRDVLAAIVGHPEGFDSLRRLARAAAHSDRSAVSEFAGLNGSQVSVAARALCLAGGECLADGLDLFRASIKAWGPESLTERYRTLFAESLIYAEHFGESLRYAESTAWTQDSMRRRLRLGATNPFKTENDHSLPETTWLAEFNDFLNISGTLSPIELVGEGLAFDRLTASGDPCLDEPLVTLVMSSWRRREIILKAVESIISQTWQSWELLIIDDASGPGFDDIYDHLASLDSRIRIVRRRVNGGTYAARNTALGIARGDFIGFQDSDDWSHPERIERQVRYLLEHPGDLACQSLCVRTDDDLSPVEPGFKTYRRNESSLLFRREIIRHIGFFDQARKGADSEYRLRLEAWSGSETPVIGPDPLALIRLTAGSLSRSELAPGFRHPSRFLYSEGFRALHARSASDLFVSHRKKPDAFVPRSLRPDQSATRNRYLDVVLVSDPRAGSRNTTWVKDLAHRFAESGHRVGFCPYFGLDHDEIPENRLAPEIAEALNSGDCEPALLGEDWAVGQVLVLDPSLLQFRAWGKYRWSVNRAVVLVAPSEGPSTPDCTVELWDRVTCDSHAMSLFGCYPEWVGTSRDAIPHLTGQNGPANHVSGIVSEELRPGPTSPTHWSMALEKTSTGWEFADSDSTRITRAEHATGWVAIAGEPTTGHDLSSRGTLSCELLAALGHSETRFHELLEDFGGNFAIIAQVKGRTRLYGAPGRRTRIQRQSNRLRIWVTDDGHCSSDLDLGYWMDMDSGSVHRWEASSRPRSRETALDELQVIVKNEAAQLPVPPILHINGTACGDQLETMEQAMHFSAIQLSRPYLETASWLTRRRIPFEVRNYESGHRYHLVTNESTFSAQASGDLLSSPRARQLARTLVQREEIELTLR